MVSEKHINRAVFVVGVLIAFPCVMLCGCLNVYAEQPIAGLQPDRRPEGAPVIESVEKGDEWYERSLKGVEPPYPRSLWFLDDQGNWYTPFTRPGMVGPYDIRNWHPESKKEKKRSWSLF